MNLLRSGNRDMEVFEREPIIGGSQLWILSGRREGHLILLKIEKRAQSDVRQYEYSEQRFDEGTQNFVPLLRQSTSE